VSESDRGSLPAEYFEAIYAQADDPWSFATSAYERNKYAATLAALPRERYRSALEIGCSIGVLTHLLAQRCDALLSVDVSERALEQARQRCAEQPWVRIERLRVPDEFPDGSFDLVLISEVGYYWSWSDLEKAAHLCAERLERGGHLLLVHWTPFVEDYPLTGDAVHDWFVSEAQRGSLPLAWMHGSRAETYRLDLFRRVD
jgi:SAM-dependent methyltransferase